MLQISKSQWHTLGQDSFDARLVTILRQHHPEQADAMPFAERYIWGATAGILRVLYERIYLS